MYYQHINYFLLVIYTFICLRQRLFAANCRVLLDDCINLFNNETFLVLIDGKETKSWFRTKENITFDGMQDGFWKNRKPCIKKINDDLIVVPNIGADIDAEFKIGCRPKFDLMLSYRGRRSYAVSNRRCKRWDKSASFNYLARDFGSPISEAHHFCRNPDSSMCGPWCFLENVTTTFDRQPCFLTCYPEKYLNRSAPCIPVKIWPLSTNDSKIYDKRFQSSVLSYSKGNNCSQLPALPREQFKNDSYEMEYVPWMWENDPLVGRFPTTFWGYGCYSGADIVSNIFIPTYARCEDLQLLCIPRAKLQRYDYKGSRSYTVSNQKCIPWARLFNDYIPHNEETKTPADEFYEAVFYDLRLKLSVNARLRPSDENARCINLVKLLDKTLPEKFINLPIFNDGPVCFVDVNNRAVAESCFCACEDFFVEKDNCIPKDLMSNYTYKGMKAETAENVSCEPWQTVEDHNYCRTQPGAIEQGPSCYTKDSLSKLQPCFKPCPSDKTLKDAGVNYFGYYPCSEEDFGQCCHSIHPKAIRAKRQLKPKSATKVNENLRVGHAESSVKMPQDLKDQSGTLTEPGVWPNVIGEIFHWITFFVLLICVLFFWTKSSQKYWSKKSNRKIWSKKSNRKIWSKKSNRKTVSTKRMRRIYL